MKSRREVKTFEFTPPDWDHVTGYVEVVTQAGQGWINLMPGIMMDEAERTRVPTGFTALFGGRQPAVTMATLMPAPTGRQAMEGMTIGLMHPTGAHAVARLAEAGAPVPDGWVVRQDHNRRGLLVRAPQGTVPTEIVRWSIDAGTALCHRDMTGEWQAVVYLP